MPSPLPPVVGAAGTAAALLVLLAGWGHAQPPHHIENGVVRIATYNVSMYRDRAGLLAKELQAGESKQAERIAEVLQRVRPDVVLLCEFDYEEGPPRAVNAFRELYLQKPQSGLEPLRYDHTFYQPVNTGVDSGMDLDRDGQLDGPADAWGYGRYPGQYGMLLLSRLPLSANWRTYREMEWRRLAEPNWPKDPQTGEHFYSPEQRQKVRLASKSFWDVGVQIGESGLRRQLVRLLCAHPTPPAFDGPEDRNGCRNYDEIRMIAEYITGSTRSSFPVDPNPFLGEGEGYETLRPDADFVVLGDLNADPVDGGGRAGAIQQLLHHPRINAAVVPKSDGGLEAATTRHSGLNANRRGDPSHDTADFGGDGHGNLRVDYVLPSKGLEVVGAGVYWPREGEPGADAVRATDHRLVWIDIKTPLGRAGDGDAASPSR